MTGVRRGSSDLYYLYIKEYIDITVASSIILITMTLCTNEKYILHFPKLSLDFGKPLRFSTFHDVTNEHN